MKNQFFAEQSLFQLRMRMDRFDLNCFGKMKKSSLYKLTLFLTILLTVKPLTRMEKNNAEAKNRTLDFVLKRSEITVT